MNHSYYWPGQHSRWQCCCCRYCRERAPHTRALCYNYCPELDRSPQSYNRAGLGTDGCVGSTGLVILQCPVAYRGVIGARRAGSECSKIHGGVIASRGEAPQRGSPRNRHYAGRHRNIRRILDLTEYRVRRVR